MSFLSVPFFAFMVILFLVYYKSKKTPQHLILLAGSIIFYLWTGLFAVIVLLAETAVCYVISWNIRGKKQLVLAVTVILLGIIIALRVTNMCTLGSFTVPLGVSYYSLMLLSYSIDVYREKAEVEKHFGNLLLFAGFFPAITQGPFNRYSDLMPKLLEHHDFDSQRFVNGLVRFFWGALKKMAIANRLAYFCNLVFEDKKAMGFMMLLALVLYFIELYADFSGCIDMALGISEMLGIELPENFKQPFFSKNVARFWRRWHITLGEWLKEYVYYPVSMSSPAKKFIKKAPDKTARKKRSTLVNSASLMILWIANGLWHGFSLTYLLMGIYFGLIVTAGVLFEPKAKKTENGIFRVFQSVRTFFLIWVGTLFFGAQNLNELGRRVSGIFKAGSWKSYLGPAQWVLTGLALAALAAVSVFEYRKGEKITDMIARQKLPVRILIYWIMVLLILFSMDTENVEPIYAQF